MLIAVGVAAMQVNLCRIKRQQSSPYNYRPKISADIILEHYEQLSIVKTNNQLATGLSLMRVATPPHIPTGHCVVCLSKETPHLNKCHVCGGFFPRKLKTAHQVLWELSGLFRTTLCSTRAVNQLPMKNLPQRSHPNICASRGVTFPQ